MRIPSRSCLNRKDPEYPWSRRQFLAAAGGCLAFAAASGCSSLGPACSAGQFQPDARKVGNRVADYVVGHQLENLEYPSICCAYGVLLFGNASANPALRQKVELAYADYLSGATSPEPLRNGRKVGHRWFGIVLLQLDENGAPRYRSVARREADLQEAEPVKDDPLYYVDHMYGVGTLQAKAFRQLGDQKYAARCCSHLLIHCQVLQRPDGLFHHSERGRPAWGRGNGWAAAAMTEALLVLPPNHPGRDELFAAWKRLVTALLQHQGTSGLWLQIVDMPESWPETSSTAMFLYALATGTRQGWIRGEDYRQAMERGWHALANSVDAEGRLADVCIGLGDNPGTVAHYLSCPRRLGDKHGQAPFLWAASAVMQLTQG
jgi:unsaturated rhamnogalacturonyl hydrolase